MGSNWTALHGQVTCQISSDAVVPTATSTQCGQYYNAVSWPLDQTSELTLGSSFVSESGTTVYLQIRFSTTTYSGYQVNLTNGTAAVYRYSGGTATQISSTKTGLTIAAGDVWTFNASGSVLSVYQNGNRQFFAEDTTYTSGQIGFGANSTVAVADAQVASWRGYNVIQQDGVWQKQGIVIPGISSDYTAGIGPTNNSVVLHEGNAQILSGTVYKTWISSGQSASAVVTYLESYDGLTWIRYGSPVITDCITPAVIENSGTYYLYCQLGTAGGTGDFYLYTSTNGISWSQISTTVIGLGTSGAWDQTRIWSFNPVAIISGTWYALYSGGQNTANPYFFSTGVATSTDGVNWTKYSGNPVITNVYCGQAVVEVGSTWYAWCAKDNPSTGYDPVQTWRYQSTNLETWTNPTVSMHIQEPYEGVNTIGGQVYPGSIIQVGNQTYAYTTVSYNDTSFYSSLLLYQLGLEIAPVTLATLVSGGEWNTTQVATDSFTSGTGPLDANWTTQSTQGALQIVSGNLVEPTTTATQSRAVYTAGTFSANQYSEVTLNALTAGNSITMSVLASPSAHTAYEFTLNTALGVACEDCVINKYVNGTVTQLPELSYAGLNAHLIPEVGDTIRFSINNNILTVYQDGFAIYQYQDFGTPITSGQPGIGAYVASGSLAGAQISAFDAGNNNALPTVAGGTQVTTGMQASTGVQIQ
jgi:hypothetical protein